MDEKTRTMFRIKVKTKNKRDSFSIFIPSLIVTAIFLCQLLVTDVHGESAKDMYVFLICFALLKPPKLNFTFLFCFSFV